jgi:4-amino-4-deoxychorismate lyase
MSRLLHALVDGEDSTRLSVLDRGLHYGDGVFRTVRVERGVPCNLTRQLARLSDDARRIGLAAPDTESLSAQAMKLSAGRTQGVLKILLTRGQGDRGYRSTAAKPTVIQLLYSMPEYPAACWRAGICLRTCETRLAINPRLAGVKHLGRIEQVLARAEWDDPMIHEGLMLDTEDRVIEGVSSNLFLVRDGELLTPDLSRCGVAGVTREMILEAAPAYTRAVRIRDIDMTELRAADECLVCNSVIGVWPVIRFENTQWPVGPVTRKLQAHFGDACPRGV